MAKGGTEKQLNDAIRIPPGSKIHLADGRVLRLQVWEPRVSIDELVSVKIEALVFGPEEGVE